jgi:hypothetical protein
MTEYLSKIQGVLMSTPAIGGHYLPSQRVGSVEWEYKIIWRKLQPEYMCEEVDDQ